MGKDTDSQTHNCIAYLIVTLQECQKENEMYKGIINQ